MAELDQRHKLQGFSGKVGKNLKLIRKQDGRVHVETQETLSETSPDSQAFREAVAYAFRMRHKDTYKQVSAERQTSSFHVATADFLHAPEIKEIDLSAYNGNPGDVVRILAEDDVGVTQVGVVITDAENYLVEMGLAQPASGGYWAYTATKKAPGNHVRVIVDAADLPGNLDQRGADKDL